MFILPNIMNLDIVILAAGKGTRMRSTKPKVMHHFLGKPFLEKVIETARTLHPKKIIPIIGYQAEEIQNYFKLQDLHFVIQEQQLGTGHAVIQAIPKLDSEYTMILYGDVPLVSSNILYELFSASSKTGIGLITFLKKNSQGFGRIVRNQQTKKIIKIVEEKDCDQSQLLINEINTGIMCVKTDFLNQWLLKLNNNNAQKEYYLTDIIELAVNDHVDIADVISSNENTIQGVNSMKELIDLERSYMKEKAQLLIDQGIKIIDPERIDIRGSLMCEEGVVIDIGCIFEGDVILKKGTYIGPYNIIKDTTIGQSNQLLAFNHIDQAIIGNGCNIGPYARIRPATSLSNNINIGNFVELKKSTVGNHTKINHLSYVGDSTIGESVNLGAGTITCNYDGANKHQTIIEDDVFIGSDTQLIAPVIIKKGATIGAGSTIVEDAPKNQLTLSRVSQKSISNWQRPKKK